MRLRKVDRVAIAAHQATIDANKAAIGDEDVHFEPVNFRRWMESCRTDPVEALEWMIKFVDGNLASAAGTQPYTDIRSHYSAFAHAEMKRRFPDYEMKRPTPPARVSAPPSISADTQDDELPF